ncbi:hypothetical protein Tco_0972584 [Tanacetum coccineum]
MKIDQKELLELEYHVRSLPICAMQFHDCLYSTSLGMTARVGISCMFKSSSDGASCVVTVVEEGEYGYTKGVLDASTSSIGSNDFKGGHFLEGAGPKLLCSEAIAVSSSKSTTQEFADEVGELRAISDHMLGAAGVPNTRGQFKRPACIKRGRWNIRIYGSLRFTGFLFVSRYRLKNLRVANRTISFRFPRFP